MKVTKGLLARIRNGYIVGVLDFQFNPSTLRRSGAVNWQWGAGPGSVMPVATFGRMGEMTINLELLFDARENFKESLQGLRAVLAEAESLGLPAVDRWDSKRNALAVAPDSCRLVLGDRSWHCEITSWTITEEMWNSKLAPVRAKVTYDLRLSNPGLDKLQSYLKQIQQWRVEYENKTLGV